MKKVIIYTRVSTDEQAEKGFSLRHQKEQLEHYCKMHDYSIKNHFQDDYSAKNFSSRPAFNKLLRYVESHKRDIDVILFTKWDRFSRNIEAAYRMIRTFKEMGIEVNSIEQPLDLSQPDSKVMLAVYLVIPEVENDKNSLRTIDGLRKAMKEGCFTGKAPKGYLHTRTADEKSTLKIDPQQAHFVEASFKMYAKGIYSAEEVRKEMIKHGMTISKNGFLSMLKNPIYIGKIFIKAYKKERETLVEGLHPAIIDQTIYDKVQLILKGKYKPRIRTLTEIDNYLPLRGFLKCPKCHKNLTGSGSKGRDGKHTYWFYHCTRYCKTRFKAKEVNTLFEHLLSELTIEGDLDEIYKSLLSNCFSNRKIDKQTQIDSLKREENKLIKRLEKAEDSFFDNQIDVNTFNTMKQRIDHRLLEIKDKLKKLQTKDKFLEKHLNKGLEGLRNLDHNYRIGTTKKKKDIVKALFSKKLIYSEHYFKTEDLDEVTRLIFFRDRRLRYLRMI